MERGICTGSELLASDDPFIKWRWKETVENYFEKICVTIKDLTAIEDEYSTQVHLAELDVTGEVTEEEEDKQPTPEEDDAGLPPMFSKLDNPTGYNARVLSWSRINSVLRTEFGNRKPLQDSKMRGLQATMLKIDFQCQLAKKIRVWKTVGSSFRPFVCIVTALNEHGLCVYWRALKSNESMKEMQDDLRKLDQRLAYNANSNKSTVKAVYIDNCCTVGKVEVKITKVFTEAAVKLDSFHWQQRWDVILESTKSKEASYFRAAMRRALFVVNEEEFNRARDVIQQKKGRRPATKEVLNEARLSVPTPILLRERVQKVLGYFFYLDSVSNAPLLNGEDPSKWPRFFKPVTAGIRHHINRQLHHVDNGCLSDPENCDMHITNAATGKHFVARGTSLNKTVNKYLNALLGSSIGIDRADRLLNSFLKVWNHRMQMQRLGAEDFGTVRTEVMALLNSLADGARHKAGELPFPTLSKLSLLPNQFKESLGLNFEYAHEDVSNPVDMSNQQRAYGEDPSADLQELLESIDWDALDDQEEEEDDEEEPDDLSFNDDPLDVGFQEEDEDEDVDVQVEQMHLLALETKAPETSMQSFSRLTNEQPWVPFRKINATTPKTALDLEEEGLFNRLHKDYKRHVSPGTPRFGYRDFELSWNIEVAERYHKKMEVGDDEEVVLINRKSYMHLQQHCDDIVESNRMSKICDPNCQRLQQLNATMRETRQQVGAPTGRVAESIQYRNTGLPMPVGAPTTFNPATTRHAIIGNHNVRQAVPWNIEAPPLPGKEVDVVLLQAENLVPEVWLQEKRTYKRRIVWQ